MTARPRRPRTPADAAPGGAPGGTVPRRAFLASAAVASTAATAAATVTPAPAARAATPITRRPSGRRLQTGAEVAAAAHWTMLRHQALGVVSNPTGVLRDYGHVVDSMAADDHLHVAGVFGPEHGFRGSAQAGSSEGTGTDPRTGLTVYDAYGADATKFAELFGKADVETVVFDIQDVGARFYTYIWTLYQAMAAAAATGRRFVVLDRPNPVGGTADGPMMTAGYESGVGLKPIVQRHGMTVGELARYFDGELLRTDTHHRLGERLSVVRVEGWRRRLVAQELNLPWVPPSPNMPTPDTAAVYVGLCYFEGTNVSEGRGTARPFELIGAPWMDYRYSVRLNAHDLPGVRFREAYFTPTFSKYVNENCAGVQVHVVDPQAFDAIRTAVTMLVEARRYDDFAWRYDDYDPERPYWIDKLSGSPRLRTMIDDGASVADVVGAWRGELADFDRRRRPYLLYPR